VALKSVQIELVRNGLREILKGPEIQRVLDEKAQAVQRAAQSRAPRLEDKTALPIEAEASPGSTRSRAVVVVRHPSGLGMEAKYRLLGSALDAARRA